MNDEIERLRRLYTTQYSSDPQDRNYIWHPLNRVAIYFRQAQERAISDLIRKNNLDIKNLRVLDVGCGTGGLLRYLACLGIVPGQLHGLDLLESRIATAQLLSPPGMSLLAGNAETLPYADDSFDLLAQFTVFSSILDAQLRRRIAAEMTRVLKKTGQLLWYDMYNLRSANLHNLSMAEIRQLFPDYAIRYLKAMHPIYASRMASRAYLFVYLLEYLPGFPKTHYLALLQKQ